MIHSKDRSGWFGASDTSVIMGHWTSETFRRWWAVKLGIRQERFTTPAMQAGNAYEHKILSALGVRWADKQIRITRLRLRVNYDGTDADMITEVKTHNKPWRKVSKQYWMQCQVEMYASGYGLRRRKKCRIASYLLTEDDLENFFSPVRVYDIKIWPIEYDEAWVNEEYLPRLKYLAKCLKRGAWPREEEINA